MPATHLLQNPQVLASLPRPIDQLTGRYVVGDVYNGAGLRKRKRAELAVGIDGEGLSIYDVQTAKLVTSYALPPQSNFTCAPYSLRTKNLNGSGSTRRTYLSTKDSKSQVTLLRDDTSATGTAAITSTYELHKSSSPVVHLAPTLSKEDGKTRVEVLIVKEDGSLQVLAGDDLTPVWSSPADALGKLPGSSGRSQLKIKFAHLTSVEEARKGLLSNVKGLDLSTDDADVEVLVLVSSPRGSEQSNSRILQIVQLPPRTQSTVPIQPIQILTTSRLAGDLNLDISVPSTYKLHASTGTLYELNGGNLITYDLTETIPQVKSQLNTDGASSLLRISATSVLTASDTFVSIWNPKFRSLHAKINLKEALSQDESSRRQRVFETNVKHSASIQLVSYLPKMETVVAIADNKLIVLQVESHSSSTGKRRATGLLIDSLGCGVQSSAEGKKLKSSHLKLNSFVSYIPGSGRSFWNASEQRIKVLDAFVDAQDVASFERVMVKQLEMRPNKKKDGLVNGTDGTNGVSKTEDAESDAFLGWKWPERTQDFQSPDPGWVAYCLSRIFTWSKLPTVSEAASNGEPKLRVSFYPHNVMTWLIRTGNLTVPNIEAALKHTPESAEYPASIPPGQIMDALIEVDPELELLMLWMANTLPSAPELLCAVRFLMRSLELFNDNRRAPKLLTQGEASTNGDEEMALVAEADEAEAALKLAEYHLGDGSNARGQALGLALSKLYCHPTPTIVESLQTIFVTNEIISLILLLRFELARGSWTSRYLSAIHLRDLDGEFEESDTSITLISNLLNSCVDAVGAGGWLSGTAMLANGDQYENEELIASLQLEVSAALEGVEEAESLKGMMTEVIRYSEGLQRSLAPSDRKKKGIDGGKTKNKQPFTVVPVSEGSGMLPFGLKVEQAVTQYKVGAGGEVRKRTARDIGRLKSQKVGQYSRERIVI